MSRKLAFLLSMAILRAPLAHAQQKAEIFGGYQFVRPDGGPNLNGWNTAITGNISKSFGITADFSGTYGSGASFYTYTFGPKFTANLPVVRPYFHALVGGAHASANIGSGDGFAAMLGGGFDAGRGRFAWRIAQFDWFLVHGSGGTDAKNVRVSTGLVLRF